MLEGDEVLDVAQETGYRLCRMANEEVERKKEERQMVFSVTWDLNNNRRMFMCMQDGQLKTIDLDVPQQYESNYGRVVQSPGAPRQLDGTDFNGAECLVHDYGVRFRRFISPHEAPEQDRPIQYHWDKIATIPGRPDELLFLLGISKSIMYTSLPAPIDNPYPTKPLLSSITRGDFTGFIYGTPVMQLCSHSSRVTSLATSPRGQLMASGDEHGHVRIIMLQLLQELTGKSSSSTSNPPGTPASHSTHTSGFASPAMHLLRHQQVHQQHGPPVGSDGSVGGGGLHTPRSMATANQHVPLFGGSAISSKNVRRPFQPNYDVTKSCHKGPIFALAWLPLIETYHGHPVFALVTGSADRVVRLWRIESSAIHGISMTPCMVLDTLSTHILSLSVLQTRSYEEDEDWDDVERPPVQVYVSAGTNLGTVHIWKIPLHEVQRRLSAPPVFGQPGTSAEVTGPPTTQKSASPSTPTNQTTPSMQSPTLGMRSALGSYHSLSAMPMASSSSPPHGDDGAGKAVEVSLLDDGRYLVSVLQPTDQPVIHVSMTNISGTMKRLRHFSGDVVVAVSDTVGKVYVYAADDGRLALTGTGTGPGSTGPGGMTGIGDKDDVFMLTSAQQATDFYIKQMRMKYESRQVDRQQASTVAMTPNMRLDFQENPRQRQLLLSEGLGEALESFVPIKTHQYRNVVVACGFSNGQLLNPTIVQPGLTGHHYGYEKGGELMICTMRGHVRVYNDLLARDYHKRRIQQRQWGPGDGDGDGGDGLALSPSDWLRLEDDFNSDLDDTDDDTDGGGGGGGVTSAAALRPLRDPNAHPNQASQSNKPLTNAFGEPFVLKMPPTVPTLAKKSTLAPKPTAAASTAAAAGNTGAHVAISAGLMAAPSASSPSREAAAATSTGTWLADTLSRHAALTQPPPPPPSALSKASPPAAPTSAIAHKPAMTLASSLALSDDSGGGIGATATAAADASAPPRPRRAAPKPTAPPSTSSLLKPTAAFTAKTSVAHGPSAVVQATVKSRAKPTTTKAVTAAAAAAHDDAASVVSGASRGSRGGKSTYSFVSRASSTGTSSGRSKRPTEDEIAYDEGIDEIEGLLPYPVDLQPSPFAQRLKEQKAAARARARELQGEGGDGDGDDSADDEEAKAFHRAQKVVAANEALTWTNPYAAPVLHSSRHVEAALQTVSGKLAALPLAAETTERAKNRRGGGSHDSDDGDDGDEAVRAYDEDVDADDAEASGYFATHPTNGAARAAAATAAWDELTVSTVHTTQSDRRRAAQALQQYYQRHRSALTADLDDDGALRLPPAQYLDARDQDELLQASAAAAAAGAGAAGAGRAGRPITGVWKKSAPAIATDYLARKQQFTLRAKDQEIFFPHRRSSTKTSTGDNDGAGAEDATVDDEGDAEDEEYGRGDAAMSRIRRVPYHYSSRGNTDGDEPQKQRRWRYNQVNGLYSHARASTAAESGPMLSDDAFAWEVNVDDIFPAPVPTMAARTFPSSDRRSKRSHHRWWKATFPMASGGGRRDGDNDGDGDGDGWSLDGDDDVDDGDYDDGHDDIEDNEQEALFHALQRLEDTLHEQQTWASLVSPTGVGLFL